MRAGVAASLAVERVNEDGAKHINKRPIAVVHGDSGDGVAGAAQQATRFLAIGQAQALIAGRNSAEFDRLMAVAESQQAMIVSPSGGGTVPPSKLVIPIGLSARERGRCLAKYLVEERKIKDAAVVLDSTSSVYGECASGFEQEFKHADRTLRTGFEVRNAKDAESVARRLTEVRPGAVVYCGSGEIFFELRSMLRANREWFDNTPIVYGGEDEAKIANSEADRSRGVILTTAFHADDKAASVQDFATRFRNRNNGRDPDSESALTYDAVMLLLTTAKKVDTFEVKKLAPEFEKIDDATCLTGPFWLTKERQPRRTVYVVEMQDGKVVLRKSYPPEKK